MIEIENQSESKMEIEKLGGLWKVTIKNRWCSFWNRINESIADHDSACFYILYPVQSSATYQSYWFCCVACCNFAIQKAM